MKVEEQDLFRASEALGNAMVSKQSIRGQNTLVSAVNPLVKEVLQRQARRVRVFCPTILMFRVIVSGGRLLLAGTNLLFVEEQVFAEEQRMRCGMAKLKLTVACDSYDYLQPLRELTWKKKGPSSAETLITRA